MRRLAWVCSVVLVTSIGSLLSACAFFPRQALPEQAAKSIDVLEPKLATQTNSNNSSTNPIEDAWWTAFGDPQLNQLIQLGLKQSPSLDTSGARIAAAQAMLESERAAFIPQVSVGGWRAARPASCASRRTPAWSGGPPPRGRRRSSPRCRHRPPQGTLPHSSRRRHPPCRGPR